MLRVSTDSCLADCPELDGCATRSDTTLVQSKQVRRRNHYFSQTLLSLQDAADATHDQANLRAITSSFFCWCCFLGLGTNQSPRKKMRNPEQSPRDVVDYED